MNYPYFAQIFNFIVVKLKLLRELRLTFCFWAGVTNITLVLKFTKSNKFYSAQTAKVVDELVVKESNFVHGERFSSGF